MENLLSRLIDPRLMKNKLKNIPNHFFREKWNFFELRFDAKRGEKEKKMGEYVGKECNRINYDIM